MDNNMPELSDIFLNIKEVSQLLKMNVSTINNFIKEGKIPSYKVGKRRLFKKEELIKWVESQRDESYKGIKIKKRKEVKRKGRGKR